MNDKTTETTTTETTSESTSTEEAASKETASKETESKETVSRDTTDKTTEETKDKKEEGKEEPKDKETKSKEDEPKDKEEKGKDKEDKGKKEGAPEKYEDFKLPEGFEIQSDAATALQDFGREHDLPQSAVQAAVDLHVSAVQSILDQQQQAWTEQKDAWEKDIRGNKDYQNDEGKSDEAIALAAKAVDIIGGEELKEALDVTGAGSHPAVFKVFYELGKRVEGDRLVLGKSSIDNRTQADKLYPTMKSK